MTSQRQMSQVCAILGAAGYPLKLHDIPLVTSPDLLPDPEAFS